MPDPGRLLAALLLSLLAACVGGARPAAVPTASPNERYFAAIERVNRPPLPPPRERVALLEEAIAASRANQRSPDAAVSLSGYMQESGALMQLGRMQEAVAVLDGRYPDQLGAGMQAEYLYSQGSARYAIDPEAGPALLDRAIAHAPTEESRAHLTAMRDSRLGRPVPASQRRSVPIPQ